MVAASLIGPFLLKLGSRGATPPSLISHEDGSEELIVELGPATTFLSVNPDSAMTSSWVPRARISDVQQSMTAAGATTLLEQENDPLPRPFTVALAYALADRIPRLVWVVGPENLIPSRPSLARLQGKRISDGRFTYIHVDQALPVVRLLTSESAAEAFAGSNFPRSSSHPLEGILRS